MIIRTQNKERLGNYYLGSLDGGIFEIREDIGRGVCDRVLGTYINKEAALKVLDEMEKALAIGGETVFDMPVSESGDK